MCVLRNVWSQCFSRWELNCGDLASAVSGFLAAPAASCAAGGEACRHEDGCGYEEERLAFFHVGICIGWLETQIYEDWLIEGEQGGNFRERQCRAAWITLWCAALGIIRLTTIAQESWERFPVRPLLRVIGVMVVIFLVRVVGSNAYICTKYK